MKAGNANIARIIYNPGQAEPIINSCNIATAPTNPAILARDKLLLRKIRPYTIMQKITNSRKIAGCVTANPNKY